MNQDALSDMPYIRCQYGVDDLLDLRRDATLWRNDLEAATWSKVRDVLAASDEANVVLSVSQPRICDEPNKRMLYLGELVAPHQEVILAILGWDDSMDLAEVMIPLMYTHIDERVTREMSWIYGPKLKALFGIRDKGHSIHANERSTLIDLLLDRYAYTDRTEDILKVKTDGHGNYLLSDEATIMELLIQAKDHLEDILKTSSTHEAITKAFDEIQTLRTSVLDKPPFPIDLVYTWAGEDTDTNDPRLANNNELKYSLRSVYEYIPWVNRIYIVMNPPIQKPSWFNDHFGDRITLLDHNDIFTDGIPTVKPVTNSTSIETALHNIPGLSEHFVYMNDDFFVGRPLPYTFLFTSEGLVRLHKLDVANLNSKFDAIVNGTKRRIALPPKQADWQPHMLYPMRKSVNLDFVDKNRDWIELIRTENHNQGRRSGQICITYNISERDPCMQPQSYFAEWALKLGMGVHRRYTMRTDRMVAFNELREWGPSSWTDDKDTPYDDRCRNFGNFHIELFNGVRKGQGPSTFVVNAGEEKEEEINAKAWRFGLNQFNFERLFPSKAPFEL